MSKFWQLYRAHTMEQLFNEPPFYISQRFTIRPKLSKIEYIDPSVASQDHPAFSLYLLMSDPITLF